MSYPIGPDQVDGLGPAFAGPFYCLQEAVATGFTFTV